MPTITVVKSDLERLVGDAVDLQALASELELAKAEVKGYDPAADEIKVELNDTNRPDLWSTEGIARQLRTQRGGKHADYGFLAPAAGEPPAAAPRIIVEAGLREIRPHVAGLLVSGLDLDDLGLRSLIQSQEKLAENFGRRRSAVAIGAYRSDLIRFPVHYRAADPHAQRFVPLDCREPLSLIDILDQHPKGREYGHLIRGFDRYPLLVDDRDEVLSMPPVINSDTLGQVVVGDSDLFVEVTGHDLRQLLLAIDIAAVDLADRGGTVRPVVVTYPYDTPFGRVVTTPCDFSEPITVQLTAIEALVGERLEEPEIVALLASMGHRQVRIGGDGGGNGRTLRVTPPPYRDDLLHPVDVIEDVAIAHDLNRFEPILPRDFTVGRLSEEETLCRRVREHLIGAGFQEVVSNILTSKAVLYDRMRRPDDGSAVEIDNPMSANFAALRNSQLPSLLAVEAVSSKALYPHRLFEIGEVALVDEHENLGSRTRVLVTALLAHPKATFSELQSYLEALSFYQLRDYELQPTGHPSFMEGRVGIVRVGGRDAGLIGEIHPECLERWGIGVPVSVFELDLEALGRWGRVS